MLIRTYMYNTDMNYETHTELTEVLSLTLPVNACNIRFRETRIPPRLKSQMVNLFKSLSIRETIGIPAHSAAKVR